MLVLGCLAAHSLEVGLFGLGFLVFEYLHPGESLRGDRPAGFNCVYYSVVVYTSIGFGDVVPGQPIDADVDSDRGIGRSDSGRLDGVTHVLSDATVLEIR